MSNQEVDLSCINEFQHKVSIGSDIQLFIGGVEVKHQTNPQVLIISRNTRQTQISIKRLIIPVPVMDTLMVPEVVSFKLVGATNYALEGDCCLDACLEHYASEHYRALGDVVLSIRLK